MDGADAVLCDIIDESCRTLDCVSLPYPAELLDALHGLCDTQQDEISTMALADRAVAMHFAQTVDKLLTQNHLTPNHISALGSHGQTIRHYPQGVPHASLASTGFTLQIGDPSTLAALTGIDVVADFRRKDIALGGQGAPLVPAFHEGVFTTNNNRVVVNIGGIANISALSANHTQSVMGFDTGPGNTLMDAWCRMHNKGPFDKNGHWASKGKVNNTLLEAMLGDAYFVHHGPKSTGREYFNIDWLMHHTAVSQMNPVDVQATLLALTATSIYQSSVHFAPADVIVCGGGAFNGMLMKTLQDLFGDVPVNTSEIVGMHPQWVEGAAFAWMAHAYIHRIPGNVPSVTGASRPAVLGALYPSM